MKSSSTIKLTLYLLIFIGIAGFSVFPKSYTKFTDSESSYLKYKADVVALNKNETDLPINLVSYSDDHSSALLDFELPKNVSDLGEIENDLYSVIVPEQCSVDNVDKEEVKFLDGEEVKRINLTCDIRDTSSLVHKEGDALYLEFSVQVNEKINDDLVPFRYKDYSYRGELPFSSVSVETNEGEQVANSKLEYFQNKIKEIILAKQKYQPYNAEITSYIDTADLSNNRFELSGLKVNYDSTTDKFYYEIEESFLGRARTYYANKSLDVKNTMIFSTNNRESLENEFEYYLNEYYSKDIDKNYLILNYIKANDGISSILLDGTNIPGITRVSDDTIKIDSNIMDYVSEMYSDNFVIIYNNDENKMDGTFKAAVNKISNINSSLCEKIKLDEEIQNELNKKYDINNISPSYYVVNDANDYILVQVSSYEKYKKVLFIEMAVTSNLENTSIKLVYPSNDKPSLEEQQKLVDVVSSKLQCTLLEDTLSEKTEENDVIITFDMLKRDVGTTEGDGVTDSNENTDGNATTGVGDDQKGGSELKIGLDKQNSEEISSEVVTPNDFVDTQENNDMIVPKS